MNFIIPIIEIMGDSLSQADQDYLALEMDRLAKKGYMTRIIKSRDDRKRSIFYLLREVKPDDCFLFHMDKPPLTPQEFFKALLPTFRRGEVISEVRRQISLTSC